MSKKKISNKKPPVKDSPAESTLLPDVKRVYFIDGIRGTAAVIVLFYHYMLSFYPGLFRFDIPYYHTDSHFEKKATFSIFNILYSGSFAVCMFFVISGYALSYGFFKNKTSKISVIPTILRRYIRLELPILFSVLISLALLSFGAYSNSFVGTEYTKCTFWLSNLWNIQPSFFEMLKESAYTTIFKGGSIRYNTVLWTMYIEFSGSLVVFLTLALFGRLKFRYFIYLVIAIVLNSMFSYLPAFIIGITLCDFYNSTERKPLPGFVCIILFALGIYIGSYQNVGTTATIWSNLDWLFHANKGFPYILGASLILLAVINMKGLQRFFSSKPIQFFGKISFSLYLIHVLVLGSLSCYLFKVFFAQYNFSYFNSFISAFVLSFAFIMGFAYLMYRYIDKSAIHISQLAYNVLYKYTAFLRS